MTHRAPTATKVCPTCSGGFSYKQRAGRSRTYCSKTCRDKRPALGLAERLWANVDKSGDCWVWTGGCTTDFGYGQIQRGARGQGCERTHRVSWTLHNGEIPTGLCVLHKCDNPPCVRPDHLFLGTRLDNNRDMLRKGRYSKEMGVKGSAHHLSKLTEDIVREARRRRGTGESSASLAREFGVAGSTMLGALNRRTWTHVT